MLNFSTFCDILLKKKWFYSFFFSENWGKMLKNRIFTRISYEIFKISQKIFACFQFGREWASPPPPAPARQA